MLCNTEYSPQRIQAAVRMMIENKVRAAAVMTSVMDAAHISELGETRDKPIVEMMVGIKVAPQSLSSYYASPDKRINVCRERKASSET